jgi:hypothetical protein
MGLNPERSWFRQQHVPPCRRGCRACLEAHTLALSIHNYVVMVLVHWNLLNLSRCDSTIIKRGRNEREG